MSLINMFSLVLFLIISCHIGSSIIHGFKQRNSKDKGSSETLRKIEKYSQKDEGGDILVKDDTNIITPGRSVSMKDTNDGLAISVDSIPHEVNLKSQSAEDIIRTSIIARTPMERDQIVLSQLNTVNSNNYHNEKTRHESLEENLRFNTLTNGQKNTNATRIQHGAVKTLFPSLSMAGCPADSCDRQMCPWKVILDIQQNREPAVLFRAECVSQTCNFPKIGCTSCRKLFQRLTYCDTLIIDKGVYIDNKFTLIPWPVACICRNKLGHEFYRRHQGSGPMSQRVNSNHKDYIKDIEPDI